MLSRILILALALAVSGCAELPGSAEMADGGHEGQGHGDAGDEEHGDHAAHEAGDPGMHAHEQTGMARPDFPPATGKVPSADEAADFPQVSSIRIDGDEGFRPAAYVTAGNGSMDAPYLIEHVYVTGDLWIADTDACFEIREVYVGGQLSLNWNGLCAWVHHSYINDLRVNENIARDGYATGGYLENNKIGFVGQLRHYDGVFQHNTVGPRPANAPFDTVLETTPLLAPDLLVANIDGFNQGIIRGNTFHGSVDLDFHGHHHGTGFYATHSHYHGDNETRKMAHDHTERWTSVQFLDNTIIDHIGYGLRYEDRNHAGDDRVANSEQEETLDLDHFHRTQIELLGNTIRGAGIWIDVFNADDKRHAERNNGTLTVSDNVVDLKQRDEGPFGLFGSGYAANIAIQVDAVKELELELRGNRMHYEADPGEGPLAALAPQRDAIAIGLDGVHDGSLVLVDNEAVGFDIAVDAARFSDTSWSLDDNDWGGAQELQADDSVPMPE